MFTVHTELNLAHQFKKIIEADGLLCIPCACLFDYLCNVKIMALILSLYVLGLNLLACNDNDTSQLNSDSEVTVIAAQDLDFDHSHDKVVDLCPPFCSCHCCHVHTVDFGSSHFEPLIVEIPSKAFAHFDSSAEEPILSFLDPPKV